MTIDLPERTEPRALVARFSCSTQYVLTRMGWKEPLPQICSGAGRLYSVLIQSATGVQWKHDDEYISLMTMPTYSKK